MNIGTLMCQYCTCYAICCQCTIPSPSHHCRLGCLHSKVPSTKTFVIEVAGLLYSRGIIITATLASTMGHITRRCCDCVEHGSKMWTWLHPCNSLIQYHTAIFCSKECSACSMQHYITVQKLEYALQKRDGYFNLAKVISVAAE